MPRPVRFGECCNCHGWGPLRVGLYCSPCHDWKASLDGPLLRCQRCSHKGRLNRNRLCRLCLLTIRTTDKTWITDPRLHRPTQLFLLLAGVALPIARGLNRGPSAATRPAVLPPRNPDWVVAALERPTADDPDLCPPLPPGQLALVRLPRTITSKLASRITDRSVAGYPEAADVARDLGAELKRAIAWRTKLFRMLRLVLAAAAAEGLTRVPQEWLVTAPMTDSVTEVLHRAGLLESWVGAPPPRRLLPMLPSGHRTAEPRPCAECESWGMETVCGACRWWRDNHDLGDCSRCGRRELPVDVFDQDINAQLCRVCLVLLRNDGPDAPTDGTVQLSLGGAFAPRLHTRAGRLGYAPPKWKAWERRKARRPAPPPISPHLADPHQPELFTLTRDWSVVADEANRFSLTPAAQRVFDEIALQGNEYGWAEDTMRPILRTLRILFGWLGAAAPIREEDVLTLQSKQIRTTASPRVLALLAERDLLIPSRNRAISVHERWVDARVAELPGGIGDELRTWVLVMRGTSRRRRRPRSWMVIRNYLFSALNTLTRWAGEHDSLREITDADVHAAMKGQTGTTAHTLRTALRSIFKALKQERLVFRDPTRAITLTAVDNLPAPLREEQLRGLLDRAETARDRLVVALVAVHALNNLELRGILLSDVDTARGKLIVRRRDRTHTIFLDELCLKLLLDWLTERQRHWPTATNTHLLTTTHGVFALGDPAIAQATLARIFQIVGVQAQHLRFDRLLDEATSTADPIHLMRVFGVSSATAMRYLHAAHPERGAAPPR
jgi:hypothetical protein